MGRGEDVPGEETSGDISTEMSKPSASGSRRYMCAHVRVCVQVCA